MTNLSTELASLSAAATPGPWQHHCSHVYGPDPERSLVCQSVMAPWVEENRDLIVALRNNLPAIIAALKAAETPLPEVAGLVERLRHCSENTRDEYLHELTGRGADLITAQARQIANYPDPDAYQAIQEAHAELARQLAEEQRIAKHNAEAFAALVAQLAERDAALAYIAETAEQANAHLGDDVDVEAVLNTVSSYARRALENGHD